MPARGPNWIGVGVAGLLAIGVVDTTRRLRQQRHATITPGHTPHLPPEAARAASHALHAAAEQDPTAGRLDALLRDAFARLDVVDERLGIAGIQYNDETIEILWTNPQPLDDSGEWVSATGGWSWTRRVAGPTVTRIVISPLPAALTIGSTSTGTVLVDLESIGVLSIANHPDYTAAALRHLLLEAAVTPLAEYTNIRTVGIPTDSLTALERLDVVPTLISDLLAEATARAASGAANRTTALAARIARNDPAFDDTPLIAVIDPSHLATHDRQALNDLLRLATPGSGIAIILGDANRSAPSTLRLSTEGSRYITPDGSSIALDPVGIPDIALGEVAELNNHAADAPEHPITTPFPVATSPAPISEILPKHDVLVRCYGEPSADGREFSTAQTQLIAMMACMRDQGVRSGDTLAGILGETTLKTFQNRVSDLRSVLGRGSDGRPLLPGSSKHDSRYRLSPLVITDIALVQHLVTMVRDHPDMTDDIRPLAAGLLRGEPFRSIGYTWAVDEGVASTADAAARSLKALLEEPPIEFGT